MNFRASFAVAALVIPAPVHDLGIVAPGSKVEHAFVLRNEGPTTVRLTGVTAACGCTVAEYDREIAPGAVGQVRAMIDTATFRPGPFSKSVEVQTDDPSLPRLTLTLRADLQPHLLVAPNRLRWTVSSGERQALPQTLTVSSPTRPDLRVTSVETTAGWLAASLRPDGAGRWLVEVHLAATPPEGALNGRVEIHTDHPAQPIVVVPVSGFVAKPAG